MKSYEHMGMANVTCSGGCACEEATIDSWHKPQSSQEFWAYIPATRLVGSSVCRLRVESIEATHSGEHKTRLSSALVMCVDPQNAQALWRT